MKNRGRVILMTVFLLIGIALWYPALRSRRVAAQSAGLTGSYGFSATAAYTGGNNPLAIVGVITFDGAGNVTGSETVVQPDPSPNATTVQSFTVPFAGTYTVNADGTGALSIALAIPNASPITASFVLTDGGSGFMLVQTGGGNSLLTGTGRKQ